VSSMKILADGKSPTTGNRYRLQSRGSRFDVIRQDAFTWRYVIGGKAIVTEIAARNLFEAMIL